jgi:tetratricopeptide (TPR) repeat protein
MEGDTLVSQDMVGPALELMTDVYERQADKTAFDAGLAQLSNSIATAHYQTGTSDDVESWLDRAIMIAEGAGAWDVLGRALNVKGLRLYGTGRPVEGRGLMRAALELALQHGLHYRAAIQSGNLALLGMYRDLNEALRLAQEAEVQARRAGDRTNEAFASQVIGLVRLHRGDWSDIDVTELRRQILRIDAVTRISLAVPLAALAAWRAEPDTLEGLALELDHSFADLQAQAAVMAIRGLQEQAAGNTDKALEDAREALRLGVALGFETDELLITMPLAIDCAIATGRLEIARSVLADVSARPPGLIPPMMHALHQWSEGRVTAAEGASERPDTLFESAAKTFADLGARFWMARTQLDHADWLNERGLGHRARPLAEQALTLMTELRAVPFVSQAQRVLGTLKSDATVMSD